MGLVEGRDGRADGKILYVNIGGLAEVAGLSRTARSTNSVDGYVGRNAEAPSGAPVVIDVANLSGNGRGRVDAVATGRSEAIAESTGLGIAGLVGVSLTEAVAEMEGKTRAYIGKDTQLTAGNVNLTATEASAKAEAIVTDGSGAGIADVNKLKARAYANRVTETFVGQDSTVDLGRQVWCIVTAQGGGQYSTINVINIAVHPAKGCCTATITALTSIKQ